MRVDFQRRVDRFAGVPLCRLLSLLPGARDEAKDAPPPRKILVILLSEMGSLVLAQPMFDRIRQKYPEASVYAMVFRKNKEVLDLLEAIPEEKVFTLRNDSLPHLMTDALGSVRALRRLGIDTVLDCELFSRVSAILSFLTGAKRRAGFERHTQEGLYRGSFLNRPVLYNPYHHIARQFLTLVEAAGGRGRPLAKRPVEGDYVAIRPLRLRGDELGEMRRRIESDFPIARGERLVLVHPGGGLLPVRAWPLASYQELASALTSRGFVVGIIGLGEDRPLAAAIQDRSGRARTLDLTGYTRTFCRDDPHPSDRALRTRDSASLRESRSEVVQLLFEPLVLSLSYRLQPSEFSMRRGQSVFESDSARGGARTGARDAHQNLRFGSISGCLFRRFAMKQMNWMRMVAVLSLAVPAAAQDRAKLTVGTATAARGETAKGWIEVASGSDPALRIPVAVVHGGKPGPVLALVAGSHGTEYASIVALVDLIDALEPSSIAGSVIIVPIINTPSFDRVVPHLNPVDGKNMNRTYPGSQDGTQSERASLAITKQVVEQSDHLIDFHGGDLDEDLRPYSYWSKTGREPQDGISRGMVLAFGLDHIIVSTGRPADPNASIYLENTASTRGKPSITVEAGHAGTVTPEDVGALVRGTLSVMRHLKMLPGDPTPVESPVWIGTLHNVAADVGGIFRPLVARGTYVQKGMKVGTVTDFFGKTLFEARAPESGVLLYVRAVPSALKGETLASIGVVLE